MKFMIYSKLFLFLEGNDDETFFNQILCDKLKGLYTEVIIWKYAQKTDNQRKRFINAVNENKNWDYLCFRDYNSAKCMTEKKKKISDKFNTIILEKVFIIVLEIESWYIAGVDNDFLRSLGAETIDTNSNYITKENFNNLIPNTMPRDIFLSKILENFNIELAITNNKSFAYFMKKVLNC